MLKTVVLMTCVLLTASATFGGQSTNQVSSEHRHVHHHQTACRTCVQTVATACQTPQPCASECSTPCIQACPTPESRDDLMTYNMVTTCRPYTSPAFVATPHNASRFAGRVFYRNGLYERGYYGEYPYGVAIPNTLDDWGGHVANPYYGAQYYGIGHIGSR